MATIQIRDIPETAYETIRRRARAEGKSIQSYMHDHVVEFASRRTKTEAMADIRAALAGTRPPGIEVQSVLDDLGQERR